jgi:hypothetical protein
MMSENRVLSRIFQSKSAEVKGGKENLCNEELLNLNSSDIIIIIIIITFVKMLMNARIS